MLGIAGDGDFLANMQELAVAVRKNLPIVYVILNNCGWQSIRNLQAGEYGEDRIINTRFENNQGECYTPNFADIGRAFGAKTWRTEKPEEVGKCVQAALDSGATSLVEVLTNREFSLGGLSKYSWWDVPVPEYLKEARKEYEKVRATEKL